MSRDAASSGVLGPVLIVDFLPAEPDIRWDYALQCGVTHAVTKLHPELTGKPSPVELSVLAEAQSRFREAGITLIGLEGDQFDMARIKEGLPGRDEDLDAYRQMLRNMGGLGIRLLCYNFMARFGWHRTATNVPTRGGAYVSGFRLEDSRNLDGDSVDERSLWENYEYFVREVIPTASEAGVRMALHPDDPPVSPLRGVARIFRTPEALLRAMSLSDEPAHGLTLCQGTLAAMRGDTVAQAQQLLATQRVRFLHFRDVEGDPDDFVETFHDAGPTDMAEMIRLYREFDFDGPVRIDHVPTMAGEDNAEPGYGCYGRLFAVGYLKGLLEGAHIAYQ
ncbi:MAG: mannonate dehydratase [Planctomycetota bacterium]